MLTKIIHPLKCWNLRGARVRVCDKRRCLTNRIQLGPEAPETARRRRGSLVLQGHGEWILPLFICKNVSQPYSLVHSFTIWPSIFKKKTRNIQLVLCFDHLKRGLRNFTRKYLFTSIRVPKIIKYRTSLKLMCQTYCRNKIGAVLMPHTVVTQNAFVCPCCLRATRAFVCPCCLPSPRATGAFCLPVLLPSCYKGICLPVLPQRYKGICLQCCPRATKAARQ